MAKADSTQRWPACRTGVSEQRCTTQPVPSGRPPIPARNGPKEHRSPPQINSSIGVWRRAAITSSLSNAGADGSHDPKAPDADASRHALPFLTGWAVDARPRARSACRQLNPCSRRCARARAAHDPRTGYEEKGEDANRRSSCDRRSRVLRIHVKTPVNEKPMSAAETIACCAC
jgi:hypothetical protein